MSFVDRCRIQELHQAGHRPAGIAVLLGRARSTISRELVRGSDPDGQYRVEAAGRRPKQPRLVASPRLRAAVVEGLARRHSPQQVSGRLRRDHPDDPEMWVSHETIYQALYVQPRGELAREVRAAIRDGKALRSGHTRRRQQRRQSHTGRIPGMINISQRPAEVQDRAIPGHWEGDLIIGAAGKSAIGTLVERTTGFVLLLHLPADHTAAAVTAAMVEAIPRLPEILRRSLTWDQGKEMSRHAEITRATGLPIYFADPHSPWQRGSNENTNGLLGQYFPKSTDLSVWDPATSTSSPPSSTPAPAGDTTGQPPPRSSTNYSPTTTALRRLLETALHSGTLDVQLPLIPPERRDGYLRELGDAVERYVGDLLRDIDDATIEPAIRYGPNCEESIDWIVTLAHLVILVEVKAVRPNLNVKMAQGEYEATYLERITRGARQIKRTNALIETQHPAFAHLANDKHRIGIIVTGEPFYLPNRPWSLDQQQGADIPILLGSLLDVERLSGHTADEITHALTTVAGDPEQSTWYLGSAMHHHLPAKTRVGKHVQTVIDTRLSVIDVE